MLPDFVIFFVKISKSLFKVHIFRISLNITFGETNRSPHQLPLQPCLKIPHSEIHITDHFLNFLHKSFCQVYHSVPNGVGIFLNGAIFL